MQIQFKYNLKEDIVNFHIAAASLGHGGQPSRQQLLYQQTFGEKLEDDLLAKFINNYLELNKINPERQIKKFQADCDLVRDKFFRRAEKIFNIKLPVDLIIAYLTANDRCGYSIKDNLFFVSINANQPKRVAMHELWHFYTWYAFGEGLGKGLDKKQYYNIKESLTEILNIECLDLMEGQDKGNIEHIEIRNLVRKLWLEEKDLGKVIEKLVFDLYGIK